MPGGPLLVAFALTVFCGSFFLFLVEPIIAKELLPWFGGAANVWATCLVFFQVGLLLGYLYADVLARRLRPRWQLPLQCALLAAGIVALPIIPAAHWKPSGAEDPALWVLGALTTTVGLPYVLMSATSPLIQSWYARCFPSRSPYRLFALSNLASMLALLLYPALVEPQLGTRWQAYVWSGGYALWALLMLACGWAARRAELASTVPPAAAPELAERRAPEPAAAPRPAQYVGWTCLAAIGSYLLVAVTNYLTRDVAAIPLLWVVPLAVYLLTFIVAFQESRWLSPWVLGCIGLGALALYGACAIYVAWPGDADNTLPIGAQIGMLCAVLAAACLFCHGTLAATRPAPGHLTRFYLTVALGGAAGSVIVGLAAPALLRVDFDLAGGMTVFACALIWATRRRRPLLIAGILGGSAVLVAAGLEMRQFYDGTVVARRNFYGALRVYDWNAGHLGTARSLSNGVILHGTQYSSASARRRPTEYYAEPSGVGRAVAVLRKSGAPLRIGVIGLGAGTLAAYGRRGDVIRFYELNPAVIEIAQHQFSYLHDSPAEIQIALGDARLSLEREPPQNFDLLAVDAFSSDAIPVHLLTREALELYLRHLKPAAIIAFHTSNRYVELPPVVERLAAARGLGTRLVETDLDDAFNTPSSWVLVSASASSLTAPEIREVASTLPRNHTRMWTDDFSDLLEFLR